jgi:formate dehydrogenase subunit gamma
MHDIATIIAQHGHKDGALLPILHDVQAAFGHVSEDTIRAVADALNLTRAEVYGVVSFYHDFKRKAAQLPVLKLCQAEACQARGVNALLAQAEQQANGKVTIEPVYCLGLCTVGPAAMMGQDVYARLTSDSLSALIEAAR